MLMTIRRRGLLIAALAIAASLLPIPGRATDGYGCGGSWIGTTPQECRVKLQGLPITVYGSAIGPNAEVHVTLVVPTFADVLILECHATDANPSPIDNEASCHNELVLDQDLTVPLPEGTVRCHVSGRTRTTPPPGAYFCRTGSVGLPV